jgi:hypothetical protein
MKILMLLLLLMMVVAVMREGVVMGGFLILSGSSLIEMRVEKLLSEKVLLLGGEMMRERRLRSRWMVNLNIL